MRVIPIATCSAVLLFVAMPAAAQRAAGVKLYISADMEGVVGTVTSDQLGPSGFEYGRFREFMTREVLAVIEAARSLGVGEILVSDSHGNGENLLIEMLPADVMIVRSWPRPLMMMQGIDSTFDAAIFIGYHAGVANTEGVRAHTISSARLHDLKLNGRSMPEGGISAAIAGHFGVPVIMVSGDDAAVHEVRGIVGDVEGAVVKWNYGYHSARTLTPEAAYRVIGDKTRTALGRLRDFKPLVLARPVTLDLVFQKYQPAAVLAYLPIVERLDAHTIRYVAPDMPAASRFIEFAMTYDSHAEP